MHVHSSVALKQYIWSKSTCLDVFSDDLPLEHNTSVLLSWSVTVKVAYE